MNTLILVGLMVAYLGASLLLPPLDLRPATREEAARLPFKAYPEGENRMAKMLMRAYGRVYHALWGSRKVDPHDARGLSAKQARRSQRRREKQIRDWEERA